MNTLEIIVLITLALLVPAIIWIVVAEVRYYKRLKQEPRLMDGEAMRILDEFYSENI